jgi:hypothetical protein
MVLHAVCGDMQLLLSRPFTPATYHVLLAKAAEVSPSGTSRNSKRRKPTRRLIVSLLTGGANRGVVPANLQRDIRF